MRETYCRPHLIFVLVDDGDRVHRAGAGSVQHVFVVGASGSTTTEMLSSPSSNTSGRDADALGIAGAQAAVDLDRYGMGAGGGSRRAKISPRLDRARVSDSAPAMSGMDRYDVIVIGGGHAGAEAAALAARRAPARCC